MKNETNVRSSGLSRTKFITISVLVLSSFLGTGYFLYAKSAKPAVKHETTKPFYTDIVKKTVASGSIVPRREVEIKSQVSGVLNKLFIEPGDLVKTGQLLAKIQIIPDVVQLNRAEADLKAATINYNNAEREYHRNKSLFEGRLISESEYNKVVLDFELREQQLESAQNNLELVKEGASKNSGNVSNLIYSTIDGTVLDVPVKEGSFVTETNNFNAGTTIVAIADMNQMIFEGEVDESEVGRLSKGQLITMKVGALEDESFDATLEYISPKGKEKDGAISFAIRAAVQLKEGVFLRSGYSANAEIIMDTRKDVLAINEGSLKIKKGKTYVEIAKGNQQYENREIETGLSDGINIEVVSGLSEDDTIKKIYKDSKKKGKKTEA